MRDAPRKPTCFNCPYDIYYCDPVPKRTMGVMMHMGERFCTGGKKARRFKRGDRKLYVPDWCPKRKNPCELRIYDLKSPQDRKLHVALYRDLGGQISPNENRYAVVSELKTELSPRKFWELCETEPCETVLPVAVREHQIVEIDDGLKPVFFYKTEYDYRILHLFEGGIARQNKITCDRDAEPDTSADKKGVEI